MYGVGLRTLRKLFLEIHPTWSNQPKDAAGLDRGKMMLKGYEDNLFKTGKTEDWDFSLMTTVLMFSKKCSLEISKKPGYEKTLKTLKECRNKLLGHLPTDKISTKEFKIHWTTMSAGFETLGADPAEMEDIKTGTFLLEFVGLVLLLACVSFLLIPYNVFICLCLCVGMGWSY